MRENYEETGLHLGEFNPSRVRLEQVENAGMLRVFTMRKDGVLVGYQVFFVVFGINTPSALMATCHVAYVAKQHRGPSGYKFLCWADERLMIEGATSITRQSTVMHPLDSLYVRMDYRKAEESWVKVNPFAISIMHGGLADGY